MPANPHPLVIVRSSPIAGKGAFARQPIAKGVVIIEYTGHRRKPRRSDLQGHADPAYHFWLRDGTLLDPSRGGNQARFLNHSCRPNCETIESDGHIYLRAIRSIKAREELTYDYLLEVPGPLTPEIREAYACHCGAARCRGTLLHQRTKKRSS